MNPAPPVMSVRGMSAPSLDLVRAADLPVELHRPALAQRLFTLALQWLPNGTTDATVVKSYRHHALNVIDISTVEDQWSLHQLAQFVHVEKLELAPFGDNDQRVGLFGGLISALAVCNVGGHPLGILC